MRRILAVAVAAVAAAVTSAGPALACGGLIGPNGAVNLTRTTTFAGYANGVEHYVTAFNFAGGTGKVGSITPLPGVPTKVERGGDWTLQRLVRETTPIREFAAAESASASSAPAAGQAEVLLTAQVDALDITVLKGNGDEVGRWAKQHGFRLPPDSPEVLDFYAQRSPIFMAAAFDADRAKARGQRVGDGTPLHLTIPTSQPWVPLRILGLGKLPTARVDADVYLLTEHRPAMLPAPDPVSNDGFGPQDLPFSAAVPSSPPGLVLTYDQRANDQLLQDLHDDKSGSWVPLQNMWLSKVVVQETAGALKYDLALDQSGAGKPSVEAAGYTVNGLRPPTALPSSEPTSQQPSTTEPAVASAGPASRAVADSGKGHHLPFLVIILPLALVVLAGGVAVGMSGRRTP
ncbi:MAG: DUF2330 domain-containing protein [Actinomycetota bacterium]